MNQQNGDKGSDSAWLEKTEESIILAMFALCSSLSGLQCPPPPPTTRALPPELWGLTDWALTIPCRSH